MVILVLLLILAAVAAVILMLAATRRLLVADDYVRGGSWAAAKPSPMMRPHAGMLGRKIAATLASTGTPAFFVHPSEASHGDLGMITPDDVVVEARERGGAERVLKHPPMATMVGIVGRAEHARR